jgi:hypothetical protein
MTTIASNRTASLAPVARLVSLITWVVVGLVVAGIVLVLLEANRDNTVVDAVLDAARWLATPFRDVFSLDSHKENVAVNYGLAALVFAVAGGLVARLLRRV